MSEQAPGRAKFDTLFADPREFRGDCLLIRRAIRQGWVRALPQADCDALVERFWRAYGERNEAEKAADGHGKPSTLVTVANVMLAMMRDDSREFHRAVIYQWNGAPTEQATGRPRERWYVRDFGGRIDAAAVRRQAKADGANLRDLVSIQVVPSNAPAGALGERVALAVTADKRGRWRVWLVCPRCGSRRVYLYATRAGIRCRRCARLRYSART